MDTHAHTKKIQYVRNSNERDSILRAIVDRLDLDNPSLEVNKRGSDNFSAALHEEDSRSIILWALLRPFLHAYVAAFPQNAGYAIPEEDVEKSVKVALNEPEFFLTQALIKAYHRKEPEFSLGKLAERRYSRGSASWEKYQRTLAREVFDHVRDLQLWHVEAKGRNDNGGGAIAGYKISAGQALIDFDTYVFQPKRLEQHQDFYLRFLQHTREQ